MSKGSMNVITSSIVNIRDNIKTFARVSPECDHRITERMEPTFRCRHEDNTSMGVCSCFCCPLWNSE